MCKQNWSHHQQLSTHQLASLCPIRTLYITSAKSTLSRASPPPPCLLVRGRVRGVYGPKPQHQPQSTKLKAIKENTHAHTAVGKVHSTTPEITSHMKLMFAQWEVNSFGRNWEAERMRDAWLRSVWKDARLSLWAVLLGYVSVVTD